MKTTGLAKLYDRLTPEERFRLVLQAGARQDDLEVDRLRRTCPRKDYSGPDLRYAERCDASARLALAVTAGLLESLARLQVAEAFAWVAPQVQAFAADEAAEAFLDGVSLRAGLGWRAAGREGVVPDLAEQESTVESGTEQAIARSHTQLALLPRVSNRIAADSAADARALWEGFSRFCQTQLELTPETVLGAHCAPLLERLEQHRTALEAASAEPAMVDRYVAALADAWREWTSP